MKPQDVLQLLLFIILLIALTPVLGAYVARVYDGQLPRWTKPLQLLERFFYRVLSIEPTREMNWKAYALAFLAFHLVGLIAVMAIQMLQHLLPWNPQGMAPVSWHLALNTAVSFITNTNWQSYGGESTMSYFTQMVALAVQNFVSAAAGICIAVALIRGIARKNADTIGNFWSDLVKGILYILLPLCVVFSLVLISQGVVQTLAPSIEITTLEGAKQLIARGPVASQVAIKMLGTNGGGFFNANAAHPFENSTPLSNFLQMLAIFLIPAALTFTFGTMARARRHGWLIFATMLGLFLVVTGISWASETAANPVFQQASLMEGKETRFGVFNSVLFSTITTSASCGGVNAMHSSLSPLSGGITMINMMLGEIIFGGVGAGLYGMLLFVLMTVFMAGLMVGRTPEYLGKKIEAREMTMVTLAILAPCAVILLGTAISVLAPTGLAGLAHAGPHGFSEILYAFTSTAANNGSAFAGLSANTVYYNVMLAIAMLIGRFAIIFPILAVAGSLAKKKISPVSVGTFEVDTPLFAVLLVGVIIIVGALTFLPALSLGPVIEHLLMMRGQTF